jgi:hypothetical protein
MRSFLALFFSASTLAAIACGGRVDGIVGDGGGACPSPAVVENGGACDAGGRSCPATETGCDGNPIDCTCSGGSWACPEPPPCIGPQPVCPTQATPGTACPVSQQGCVVSTSVDYCGVFEELSCTCELTGSSLAWDCDEPPPPPDCNDAGACPSPSAVEEGFACDVSSGTSCVTDDPIVDCDGDVTGYISCECSGGSWACPFPPVMNCQDAGGPCPKPNDVVQDTACSSDGQQCPGNPQVCGGQVLYDAFECEQGLWQDVAVTDCDIDAGQ